MKLIRLRIICFLMLGMIASYSSAQGSLQFNQIKLVSASESVPSGKVWKIEGVIYSSGIPDPHCTGSTTCSSMAAFNDVIVVNGVSTSIRSVRSRGTASGGSGTTTYLWEQKFPIWLPASSTLAASTGISVISVVEFNLMP